MLINALKWFITAFFGALSFSIPELIRRIFGFVGIGYVTYTGMNLLESQLILLFQSQLVGLPAAVLQFLGIMHIDDAFSMIMSAWAIRKIFEGWSSGSRSAFTYRNNGSAETNPWSGGGPPKTGGWF